MERRGSMIGIAIGLLLGYAIHGIFGLVESRLSEEPRTMSLEEAKRTITARTLSRDGQVIVRGFADGSITFWRGDNTSSNAGNPEPVGKVPITALALSHDDRWLISGDAVGQVVLWDAVNRKKIKELLLPSVGGRKVLAIAFIEGDKWAIVMSEQGMQVKTEARVIEIPSGLDLILNDVSLEEIGEYAGGIAEVRRTESPPVDLRISPSEGARCAYHRRRLTEIR